MGQLSILMGGLVIPMAKMIFKMVADWNTSKMIGTPTWLTAWQTCTNRRRGGASSCDGGCAYSQDTAATSFDSRARHRSSAEINSLLYSDTSMVMLWRLIVGGS